MSARKLGVWIAAALLAACSSDAPSRLDKVVTDKPKSSAGAGDPWSSSKSRTTANEDDEDGDGGGLAGVDLKGMLEKKRGQ